MPEQVRPGMDGFLLGENWYSVCEVLRGLKIEAGEIVDSLEEWLQLPSAGCWIEQDSE